MSMAFSVQRTHIPGECSQIAVIGGGPTGSFFSLFALRMAKMIGREISITIFDPKDFSKDGPGGCNRCGGIISELLVQTLAVEGINLPNSVVRKGINSYTLHTDYGSVFISTPSLERTIATVYRGGGPRGIIGHEKESFDNYLLSLAIEEGAVHQPMRIDSIERKHGKPVLFSKNGHIMEADLAVGAFGVNSTAGKMFASLGFGYSEPPTVNAAIAELHMPEEVIVERFGNSIHLFLLPDRGIKFAAMIPKGSYVTLCILGRKVDAHTVQNFLNKPVVRAVLPEALGYSVACSCLPKMNIGAPKKPFTDRIVMGGDAGSTRLFKDGLGAAYIMGKSIAKTVIFEGTSREDFQKGYYPVYRGIMHDNLFGRILYTVIDQYRSFKILTRAMLKTVEIEQKRDSDDRILSTILWDMFTGNERYRNVFMKSIRPKMHIDMWEGVFRSIGRR